MKRFAFVGWSGSTGPTVPSGGRARHLENLANAFGDAARLPETPTITSLSPEGFPSDDLVFETSPFVDPEEDQFVALRWRLGEITPPGTPFDPNVPRRYEYPAIWEYETDVFENTVSVPQTAVLPGRTYRVRAKMKNLSGRWSHWSEPVEFVAGQPEGISGSEAALRITELMYNPLGDEDYEFIELQNVGAERIDLRGVELRDGVEFEFAGSDVESLAPGAYVVVVKNRAVFATRYATAGIRIAGEYSGRFANGGERVELAWGQGVTVLAFEYDDEWYATTDGEGRSLVVADSGAPVEAWNTAEGWQESADLHGSPGRTDGVVEGGGQLAGDVDQSGSRSVTDAIAILRVLSAGAGLLPCGDGTFEDPANQMLLDLDGSGSANLTDAIYLLTYLFGSGPSPALGRECLRIPGCPDVCAP